MLSTRTSLPVSIAILLTLGLFVGAFPKEQKPETKPHTAPEVIVQGQAPLPPPAPNLPGVNWSGPGWYVAHSGTAYTPSVAYQIDLQPATTVFFCPGGPYPSESAAYSGAAALGYFK